MSVILPVQQKNRSETVSFRISSNLRTILEEEARRLGLNLNTLVSQIFSRYANWERFADRLKFLPVSKDLLREMFQPMQRETVERIGRRVAETSAREQILFLYQQISVGTVLRFIEVWTSHFDAYEHRYDGRRHFFTLHHDVNLNFSLFAKEYVSSIIQSTVSRTVQFDNVSANSLTFSFDG